MSKVKSIKEQLQEGNIKFHVAGQIFYCKGEDGEYGMNPRTYRVSDDAGAINSYYDGMNVSKWGPTCVTLYTFNILGKRSVGKIKYSDVTIVGKVK